MIEEEAVHVSTTPSHGNSTSNSVIFRQPSFHTSRRVLRKTPPRRRNEKTPTLASLGFVFGSGLQTTGVLPGAVEVKPLSRSGNVPEFPYTSFQQGFTRSRGGRSSFSGRTTPQPPREDTWDDADRLVGEENTPMTKPEEFKIPKPLQALMLVVSNESRVAVGLTGAVYRATMDGTTLVAVKIVKNLQAKKTMNRFYDEIDRLQSLPSHPHLVQYCGYTPLHNGKQVGIVAEFIAGPTLANRLYRSPAAVAMPEKTKYRVILQLLDALVHLHYHDVTHRDLSPKHVLLESKSGVLTPKLVDFGLPTLKNAAVSALAATGAMGFDPAYASPELLNGELAHNDVDACKKSDVFSFVVLMVELLLEEHPWEGELRSFFTKAVRKRGDRPFDVKDLRVFGQRSSDLEYVTSRAWHQDAHKRPTAAALRAELQWLLSH